MLKSAKELVETAVTYVRGIIILLIVFFFIAVMYAPIVFAGLTCIELILPRSMKMKGNLGDFAWIISIVAGIAAFTAALVSPQELSAMPLFDYLNQQALEQNLEIGFYMGIGMALMIGGRSVFNTLGLQGR